MVFTDRFDDDERLFEFVVISEVPFGFVIRGVDAVGIIASPSACKHDGFLWGLPVLFSICLIALFLLGWIAFAYGDDDVDVSAVELAQFFKARGIVIFARFVILPRIECDDGIALFNVVEGRFISLLFRECRRVPVRFTDGYWERVLCARWVGNLARRVCEFIAHGASAIEVRHVARFGKTVCSLLRLDG